MQHAHRHAAALGQLSHFQSHVALPRLMFTLCKGECKPSHYVRVKGWRGGSLNPHGKARRAEKPNAPLAGRRSFVACRAHSRKRRCARRWQQQGFGNWLTVIADHDWQGGSTPAVRVTRKRPFIATRVGVFDLAGRMYEVGSANPMISFPKQSRSYFVSRRFASKIKPKIILIMIIRYPSLMPNPNIKIRPAIKPIKHNMRMVNFASRSCFFCFFC